MTPRIQKRVGIDSQLEALVEQREEGFLLDPRPLLGAVREQVPGQYLQDDEGVTVTCVRSVPCRGCSHGEGGRVRGCTGHSEHMQLA